MGVLNIIRELFKNDSDQPDDQSAKIVWTKYSEPVLDDHTEEYRELKSKRITPSYITSLEPNEVFVFGSNVYGIHDGGASECASKWFGAIEGQAEGPQGNSYAIPTDGVSLDEIKYAVDIFTDFAIAFPELTFLVTEIGCGTAGYHPSEIAPLFKDAVRIKNICLPKIFWDYLNTKS